MEEGCGGGGGATITLRRQTRREKSGRAPWNWINDPGAQWCVVHDTLNVSGNDLFLKSIWSPRLLCMPACRQGCGLGCGFVPNHLTESVRGTPRPARAKTSRMDPHHGIGSKSPGREPKGAKSLSLVSCFTRFILRGSISQADKTEDFGGGWKGALDGPACAWHVKRRSRRSFPQHGVSNPTNPLSS